MIWFRLPIPELLYMSSSNTNGLLTISLWWFITTGYLIGTRQRVTFLSSLCFMRALWVTSASLISSYRRLIVICPFANIIKGSGGFFVPRTYDEGSSTVAGDCIFVLLWKFEGDGGEIPYSTPSLIRKYRADERFPFCWYMCGGFVQMGNGDVLFSCTVCGERLFLFIVDLFICPWPYLKLLF